MSTYILNKQNMPKNDTKKLYYQKNLELMTTHADRKRLYRVS